MTWRTPAIIALTSLAILGFRSIHSGGDMADVKPVPVAQQEVALALTPESSAAAEVAGISTESAEVASVSATPTTSISASPTASPTATPTKKPTPTPTPTPKPQPKFTSEQVYHFTDRYGILYAVDPNVLRHIAICESGFDPSAHHLWYAGLFQFDSRTWEVYRSKMGWDPDPDIRYNAEEAVKTAAYVLSLGKTQLWPVCYPH